MCIPLFMNKGLMCGAMLAFGVSSCSPINDLLHPTPEKLYVKGGSGAVYNLGFEEGMADIANLCNRFLFEDMFFFDGYRWYDVGIHETNKTVAADTDIINELYDDKENQVLIHLHYASPGMALGPSKNDFIMSAKFIQRYKNLTHLAANSDAIWAYSWKASEDELVVLNKFWNASNASEIDSNLQKSVDSICIVPDEAQNVVIDAQKSIGHGMPSVFTGCYKGASFSRIPMDLVSGRYYKKDWFSP